ncbi:MAG TPA: glycosyltransferase family 2 protein [Candidatus Aminicenantes bacterium]|nr:glycosyltransferase family 2 protein [Candidatus Aminicenantes bacterium]
MNRPDPTPLRLSVVVPSYNKEARIAAALEAVAAFLAAKPFASEIVAVDDGSSDRTAAAARSTRTGPVGLKVLRLETNRGKGAAVREGVLAAAGETVLFMDDDLATSIEELDKVLAAIEAGADVVIGSRALPDSTIKVRQRRPRELMGKAFNVLVRLFVLRGYRDTQCGFKGFRREAARAVFTRLRTAGFGFDVEVLVLCRELGYLVVEIPITWRDARPSRLRLVKGSWGMLKDLWRIRRQVRRERTRGRH